MFTKTFSPLLLGLVLICLNLLNLGAQETWTNGYIITNSGEKREGQIQYVSGNHINEICHFKASNAAQIEDYEPGQIQEYFFDQVKCASKSFAFDNKSNVVFAECLFESANYVLYRYKRQYIVEDKTSKTEPFRFGFQSREGENEALAPKAKKDDARLVALTQSLLTALGTPVEKLTNTLPRVDRLKQILIDYHEAKKIPFKVYEDVRGEMNLTFGIVEAIFTDESTAKIFSSDIFEKGKIPTAYSFGAAIPVTYSAHPSYGRISVLALPGFRQITYGFSQQVNARKYNYSFKGTILQVALLMKYNLIPYGNKLQANLQAGPNIRWLVGDNSTISETYRNSSNRDTLTFRETVSIKGNVDVDLFTGLELGYQFNNGGLLYLGVRNHFNPFRRTFYFGTRGVETVIQSQPFSLFLGYRPKMKSGLTALLKPN
jgi:hypothetical protein